MKVWISEDEWYPVLDIDSDPTIGVEVELTDEEYARYEAAMAEFKAVQRIFAERIKGKQAVKSWGDEEDRKPFGQALEKQLRNALESPGRER